MSDEKEAIRKHLFRNEQNEQLEAPPSYAPGEAENQRPLSFVPGPEELNRVIEPTIARQHTSSSLASASSGGRDGSGPQDSTYSPGGSGSSSNAPPSRQQSHGSASSAGRAHGSDTSGQRPQSCASEASTQRAPSLTTLADRSVRPPAPTGPPPRVPTFPSSANEARHQRYTSNASISTTHSVSNSSLYGPPSVNPHLRRAVSYGSFGSPHDTEEAASSTTYDPDSEDPHSLTSPSSIDWEEPPPYEINLAGRGGNVSAEVQNNGRISMMFDSSAKIPDAPMTPLEKLPEGDHKEDYKEDYKNTELTPDYAISAIPNLNIVVQVVGSRGDIQPFIALGKELQKSGHRIRIATHDVFADFVRSAGLEFFPVGGDPEQLMAYMVNNPGIIPKFATIRAGEITRKRKMIYEMLEGFWRSCVDPDPDTKKPFVAEAIIANPPGFAHIHCAQALGVPVHLMFTMPWTPTRAFPHPLANIQRSDNTSPQTSNYLSYGLVEVMTWQGLSDVVNLWRRKILHLEPIRAMMGAGLAETLKIPFTYCWSPALVPKPRDWPRHVDVCGFFFREPPEYTPPEYIDEFLKAGDAPIYVGFGSIVMDDAEAITKTILAAVEKTGVRAIISRGWSKLGSAIPEGEVPANVLFIDDCPHEWLFQQVTMVCHHGGAGTTACGLRNGRPTTIVPFFGDQPFWGNMVAVAKAGPRPIDHKSFTVDRLVHAIQTCLTPEAQAAANVISQKMSWENGVKTAVRSFHRNLPVSAMTCDILPKQVAVWRYKTDKTFLKLSDKAAFILMEAKKVDIKKLKRYQSKPIEIEEKRWDPFSAGSSALLSAVVDVASDGKDLVTQPIKELRKASTLRREGSETGDGQAEARHAFKEGLSTMGGTAAKGLINVPVAMADGFAAIPRYYGEKTKKRAAVTDWKSGAVVATKGLGLGFLHGFTGIVTQPIKGAVDDGFIGFGKGFVAGSLGVVVKPGAAMLGLVGYSLLGAYKSIQAQHATPTEARILLARQIQGSEMARQIEIDDGERAMILREFEEKTK